MYTENIYDMAMFDFISKISKTIKNLDIFPVINLELVPIMDGLSLVVLPYNFVISKSIMEHSLQRINK